MFVRPRPGWSHVEVNAQRGFSISHQKRMGVAGSPPLAQIGRPAVTK
jgi:hypothetical protein